jgi:hypothetical protein
VGQHLNKDELDEFERLLGGLFALLQWQRVPEGYVLLNKDRKTCAHFLPVLDTFSFIHRPESPIR